jgi:hypothetical protein
VIAAEIASLRISLHVPLSSLFKSQFYKLQADDLRQLPNFRAVDAKIRRNRRDITCCA